MGLDVSSYLVIGVGLERCTKTIVEQKFNENTGKPYVKPTHVREWRIGGTEIAFMDHDSVCKYEIGEIGPVYSDYENEESYFFGIIVASTYSSGRGNGWFHVPSDLSEPRMKISQLLFQKYKYEGPVGAFLITRFSY